MTYSLCVGCARFARLVTTCREAVGFPETRNPFTKQEITILLCYRHCLTDTARRPKRGNEQPPSQLESISRNRS